MAGQLNPSGRGRNESANRLAAPAASRWTLGEEPLRAIIESAPDAIVGVDAQGLIVLANDQAERLFGYPRGELLGQSVDILVPERLRSAHSGHRDGYVADPHTRPMGAGLELFGRRKDGSEFPVEISLSPLETEHGLLVTSIIRDVTDRRAAAARLASRERQLLGAQAIAQLGSWEWDIPADVVTWSDELYRIYGLDPDSFGSSYGAYLERVHPEDREMVQKVIAQAFEGGGSFEFTERIVRPDGEIRVLESQGELISDETGAPLRMVGVCQDITEQEAAQGAARRLVAIVETSHDAILSIDLDRVITSWNPAAERLYGFPAGEAVGRGLDIVLPEEQLAEHERALERVMRGEQIREFETRRLRRDGTLIDVALSIAPLYDAAGDVVGASSISRDITDRKRQEAEIRHLAGHDPLTDLPNRRTLEETLQRVVARAERGQRSALLIMDLDNFKLVNDTLGHPVGDELLGALASVLAAALRPGDFLARLGGDEFAVLGEDVGAGEAVAIAERLVAAVNAFRFERGEHVFDLGISVGVALIDGELDPDGVMSFADAALYAAKDRGRNQAVLLEGAEEKRAEMAEASRWASRIKDALAGDLFSLRFQPIVRLATREVEYHEALIRLNEVEGPPTLPGAFIPAAERFGLMPQIDRWVLERALDVLEGDPELRIFVNLSGTSLGDQALLDYLVDRLSGGFERPERLGFEITETAVVGDLIRAQAWMARVREIGCRFALDDFGIRFSSFSYLRALPADYVKIDGSFIRNLGSDPASRPIVQAITTASHALGKRVIAEWIESAQTARQLALMGVECGQGYLWGSQATAEPTEPDVRRLANGSTRVDPVPR